MNILGNRILCDIDLGTVSILIIKMVIRIHVSIGTHEADPSVPECVDCNSFEKRDGCR